MIATLCNRLSIERCEYEPAFAPFVRMATVLAVRRGLAEYVRSFWRPLAGEPDGAPPPLRDPRRAPLDLLCTACSPWPAPPPSCPRAPPGPPSRLPSSPLPLEGVVGW